MKLKKLIECIREGKYEWRKHVLIRLAERKISQRDILKVICEGEVIEDYPNSKPFPSCLLLGRISEKPYHVVVAMDYEQERVYIITAYEPSIEKFEPDFKKRRTK